MLELVRYFNEHYGQEYENIEYPTTKKEIYQTYQVVKSYGIKDDRLVELLNEIVLPKPETIKEKEMYSECLYEVSGGYERKSVLKLTKDDFIYDEEKKMIYYKTNKLDWLNTKEDVNKIGFKIKRVGEIQQSSIENDCYTEKDIPLMHIDEVDYGMIICEYRSNYLMFAITIANGIPLESPDKEPLASSDFIIGFNMSKVECEALQELEFELFKIEGNKISQDVLPYKLEFRDDEYLGRVLDVTIDGETLTFKKVVYDQ